MGAHNLSGKCLLADCTPSLSIAMKHDHGLDVVIRCPEPSSRNISFSNSCRQHGGLFYLRPPNIKDEDCILMG
jgi:hypothetical protein